MNRFTAFTTTQLKNETGSVLEEAARGPVKLTSHGRARVYIVPAETFERLIALEDVLITERALRAQEEGFVGPGASMALLQGISNASDRPYAQREEGASSTSTKGRSTSRRKAGKSKD